MSFTYRATGARFASEAARLANDGKQQRFAMSLAINDTLFAAREAVISGMSVFDRATPFTQRSPRVVKASPANLVGALVIPTEPGGAAAESGALGTLPAGKPLLAEVAGGARRFKRSEKLLHAKGILPRGYFAVPGPAAEIDTYGNWTRGQILHLLAYFEAFGKKSRSGKKLMSNTTAAGRIKLKRGVPARRTGGFGLEYFVIQPGTKGLKPGVYVRRTTTRKRAGPAPRVRAVLFFVTRTQYRALYHFHQVAGERVESTMPERFQIRLAEARATARPQG